VRRTLVNNSIDEPFDSKTIGVQYPSMFFVNLTCFLRPVSPFSALKSFLVYAVSASTPKIKNTRTWPEGQIIYYYYYFQTHRKLTLLIFYIIIITFYIVCYDLHVVLDDWTCIYFSVLLTDLP